MNTNEYIAYATAQLNSLITLGERVPGTNLIKTQLEQARDLLPTLVGTADANAVSVPKPSVEELADDALEDRLDYADDEDQDDIDDEDIEDLEEDEDDEDETPSLAEQFAEQFDPNSNAVYAQGFNGESVNSAADFDKEIQDAKERLAWSDQEDNYDEDGNIIDEEFVETIDYGNTFKIIYTRNSGESLSEADVRNRILSLPAVRSAMTTGFGDFNLVEVIDSDTDNEKIGVFALGGDQSKITPELLARHVVAYRGTVAIPVLGSVTARATVDVR